MSPSDIKMSPRLNKQTNKKQLTEKITQIATKLNDLQTKKCKPIHVVSPILNKRSQNQK